MEQCPELGSSVRCSVQPCGGQCPVQSPRWAAVQAPERVVSGGASGGRGPGRARCAPCSPGTGALGARAQRRDPPPESPPLRPPPPFFLSSLLYRAGSNFRHSRLRPIPAPGAGRGHQSGYGNGGGCVTCLWLVDSGAGPGTQCEASPAPASEVGPSAGDVTGARLQALVLTLGAPNSR